MRLIFSAVVITLMMHASCVDYSKEVNIGSQVWMSKNLNVDRFRNGDRIPHAETYEEWERAGETGQPAWCYYNNDSKNGKKYGRLYNWYAVNDPRGLAPKGWRIPSEEDWGRLIDFLGGWRVAGTKLKSTSGWKEDGNGTNESGFSGLPGGYRYFFGPFSTIDLNDGAFYDIGGGGRWWSSSEHGTFCRLGYTGGGVAQQYANKDGGFSVRCIKDN
jgi:uncharacterized protein (TIGR02145 family)